MNHLLIKSHGRFLSVFINDNLIINKTVDYLEWMTDTQDIINIVIDSPV